MKRILIEGSIYHVSALVNYGLLRFKLSEFRKLFTEFIKTAKNKFGFKLYNFVIMENHIHLVIQPTGTASLSKIMQWLLGNFSKAWNKAHGLKGHFWKAKFFSRLLDESTDIPKIFDYIFKNPVKADLVKKAEDWADGGLGHFIAKNDRILDVPLRYKAIYEAYSAHGTCHNFNFSP
jgi:putative transposase